MQYGSCRVPGKGSQERVFERRPSPDRHANESPRRDNLRRRRRFFLSLPSPPPLRPTDPPIGRSADQPISRSADRAVTRDKVAKEGSDSAALRLCGSAALPRRQPLLAPTSNSATGLTPSTSITTDRRLLTVAGSLALFVFLFFFFFFVHGNRGETALDCLYSMPPYFFFLFDEFQKYLPSHSSDFSRVRFLRLCIIAVFND
jgi:hypothetical protein